MRRCFSIASWVLDSTGKFSNSCLKIPGYLFFVICFLDNYSFFFLTQSPPISERSEKYSVWMHFLFLLFLETPRWVSLITALLTVWARWFSVMRGCVKHFKMVSIIPGFYPPETHRLPVLTIKNNPGYYWISTRDKTMASWEPLD